jgi:ribonuclease Z
MRSVFFPQLVNGPFGDPALYVRLAHRDKALLFDCGDLHPLTPRAALKIAAVFISHAHIDHLVGFDALLRLFLYRPQPLLLFGPPGIASRIAARLGGYTWNLTQGYPFALTVREWSPTGAGKEVTFSATRGFRAEKSRSWVPVGDMLLQSPAYSVRTVPLSHGDITSLAFVLEEPLHVAIHQDALARYRYRPGLWLTTFKDQLRGGAPPNTLLTVPLLTGNTVQVPLTDLAEQIAHRERGMKICYVTDAAPSPDNLEKIVQLARDAHLLVIEAPFSQVDFERAQARNHLTAQLAGELARQAGVARLSVFHHSPRYQDNPGLLQREALGAFAGGLPEENCAETR